jgi:hypothetical protein
MRNMQVRRDDDGREATVYQHFLKRNPIGVVMFYVLFGSVIFYGLEEEQHLSVVDALYLATVILTTVGYGDVAPETAYGKLFCMVYLLGGLTLVATSVGILAHQFLHNRGKHAPDDTEPDGHEYELAADYYSKSAQSHRQKASLGKVARCFITIVLLLACGSLFMYFECHTDLVDSLYWSVISLTSVGFGDVHTPAMDLPPYRLFASLYLLVGVAVTASSLGEVVTVWMEIQDEQQLADFLRTGVTMQAIGAWLSESGRGARQP